MTRWIVGLCAVLACAQVAEKANERYRSPESRGRIADSMMSAERHETQRPEQIVAWMKLKPGMVVADVGTGPGYMLPYLAAAVGPSGRTIAQDIFPDMLERAKTTAEGRKLSNVEFVLGTERDARLPEGQVDLVLVLDAYHHFNYPSETLASLRRGLKPSGRLVVVDYHKSERAMRGIGAEHVRLSADDAVREIEANGFRLVERHENAAAVQWVGIFARR